MARAAARLERLVQQLEQLAEQEATDYLLLQRLCEELRSATTTTPAADAAQQQLPLLLGRLGRQLLEQLERASLPGEATAAATTPATQLATLAASCSSVANALVGLVLGKEPTVRVVTTIAQQLVDSQVLPLLVRQLARVGEAVVTREGQLTAGALRHERVWALLCAYLVLLMAAVVLTGQFFDGGCNMAPFVRVLVGVQLLLARPSVARSAAFLQLFESLTPPALQVLPKMSRVRVNVTPALLGLSPVQLGLYEPPREQWLRELDGSPIYMRALLTSLLMFAAAALKQCSGGNQLAAARPALQQLCTSLGLPDRLIGLWSEMPSCMYSFEHFCLLCTEVTKLCSKVVHEQRSSERLPAAVRQQLQLLAPVPQLLLRAAAAALERPQGVELLACACKLLGPWVQLPRPDDWLRPSDLCVQLLPIAGDLVVRLAPRCGDGNAVMASGMSSMPAAARSAAAAAPAVPAWGPTPPLENTAGLVFMLLLPLSGIPVASGPAAQAGRVAAWLGVSQRLCGVIELLLRRPGLDGYSWCMIGDLCARAWTFFSHDDDTSGLLAAAVGGAPAGGPQQQAYLALAITLLKAAQVHNAGTQLAAALAGSGSAATAADRVEQCSDLVADVAVALQLCGGAETATGQQGQAATAAAAVLWAGAEPQRQQLQHELLPAVQRAQRLLQQQPSDAAAAATSDAGLRALPQQLHAFASAVCAALPHRFCCNNPGCTSLAGASEQQLVGGKRCICTGCRTARYCGEACQLAHWRAHKPVCRRLKRAAAEAAAAVGGH